MKQENAIDINIDPAKEMTGAGVNKFVSKKGKVYTTLSDGQLETLKTNDKTLVFISDPVVQVAGIKQLVYLTTKHLRKAYEQTLKGFSEKVSPSSTEQETLHHLDTYLHHIATETTTVSFNKKVVEIAKKGAGICFLVEISDGDTKVEIFNPIDKADFEMPFICIKRYNTKGVINGTFDLGKLNVEGGRMVINNHKGDVDNFSSYIGDESDNGKIWEIEIRNRSNYAFDLNVLGKGPKGIGSGELNLIFCDEEKDTYTLGLRSSKKKWHVVKYSSDDPAITKLYWFNFF